MKRIVPAILAFLGLCQVFSTAVLAETPCAEYQAPGTAYPHFLGTADGTNGRYNAIASKNGLAYAFNKGTMSNSPYLFRVLELGTHISQRPVIRGQLAMPASGNRIILRGDYAYMPLGSLGIGAIDVSDPDALPPITLTGTGDVCRDLAFLGSDHVITAEWSAIRIYDLSLPAMPDEIAGLTLAQARTVAVSGDLAFVACGLLGLGVVDISNPAIPSLLTQMPVGGFVDQVAAVGSRVYLTGLDIGLVTVDAADPEAPQVFDVLELDGEPERITIRDGYAYIICGDAITVIPGQLVLDVMALVRLDPDASPVLVDYFFPKENFTSVALGDDLLLLGETDEQADLVLAPLQCPATSGLPDLPTHRLRLAAPWPNPFNPRVSIRFTLPEDQEGGLTVHDLRGNLVAEIWRGTGSGREFTVLWDGKDRSGRTCSSGAYGFLLTAAGGRRSEWVTGTLLR